MKAIYFIGQVDQGWREYSGEGGDGGIIAGVSIFAIVSLVIALFRKVSDKLALIGLEGVALFFSYKVYQQSDFIIAVLGFLGLQFWVWVLWITSTAILKR